MEYKMARRRVVNRKRQQNKFSMFLVSIVVLLVLVAVSVRSMELQEKLDRIDALEQQQESIRLRRESLTEKKELLENHRQHLQYEAGREYAKKLESALYQRDLARETTQKARLACENLPEEGVLQQKLRQMQRLKEQKEALQMELQMQFCCIHEKRRQSFL